MKAHYKYEGELRKRVFAFERRPPRLLLPCCKVRCGVILHSSSQGLLALPGRNLCTRAFTRGQPDQCPISQTRTLLKPEFPKSHSYCWGESHTAALPTVDSRLTGRSHFPDTVLHVREMENVTRRISRIQWTACFSLNDTNQCLTFL